MDILEFNIEADSSVYLRHHSRMKPFKATVKNSCNGFLLFKVAIDFEPINYTVGDPIVLSVVKDEELYFITCIISDIMADSSLLTKIEEVESINNMIDSRKIPVSIYADLFLDGKKRNRAVIRSISYNSVLFVTNIDLKDYNEVRLETYLEEKVISLRATIEKRVRDRSSFEYGANTVCLNYNDNKNIRNYIDKVLAQ